MCLMEKSPGASLHPRGVDFHLTRYIGCLYQGETILNPLPLPSALWISLQGDGVHVHDEYDLSRTIRFYFISWIPSAAP